MLEKKAYISNLNLEEKLIRSLLAFLISKKYLLSYFENDSIDIIKSLLTEKPYYFYEYLLFKSPQDYCNYLKSKDYEFLPVRSLNALKVDCEEENIFDSFLSICIEGYTSSNTFGLADKRFKGLIQPNLEAFSIDQLKILIQKIDKNSQVYARNSASNDHKLIIERVLSINKNLDFKNYRNFIRGNTTMLTMNKIKKVDSDFLLDDILDES